jgi:hypothetical protein
MRIVLSAVLLIFFSIPCLSQRPHEDQYFLWPVDVNTQKIVFSESVNMQTASQDSLYANAKQFLMNTFKSNKDTIFANDASKKLVCRCSFFIPVEQLGERGKGFVHFTFSIDCSNNSYKYSLSNFEHLPLKSDGVAGGALENDNAASGRLAFPNKYWDDQKAKCYYRIETTIERLKETITKVVKN